MKTHTIIFQLALLMLFTTICTQVAGQESAIYAGGPVYMQRDYAINELRDSGFTTVIVWTIHIESNGDLGFNGEFPLVKNGIYVGNDKYPNFPNDVAKLKTAPTSINRIEFGLSGYGSGTFNAVKNFYNSEGFGPGTTLYKNFEALKNAIPAIDAFNNDDESTYHTTSAVAFTKMLAGMGFKNAIVPYTNSSFWSTLVSQVNSAYPGNIDRTYLQCYAGGSGNTPCSSTWDFGIPVYPGMWGGANHSSTTAVENQMNNWQNSCNIIGGFMWLYDAFDNSPDVAAYAAAINNALQVNAPGTASSPTPSSGSASVNTNIGLSWTAGSGASSHDVYFGTNSPLTSSDFIGNQSGSLYTPSNLGGNTTYYWRIDEKNSAGTTVGTEWNFTTTNTTSNNVDHTDPVGTGIVTARTQIHNNENKNMAFDNLYTNGTQNLSWSKWLDNGGIPSTSNPSWIQIQLPGAVIVNKLAIVSANDAVDRDPKDFNIQGSNNGLSWSTLASWTNQTWGSRFQKREFGFTNSTSYKYYRINTTKNRGNGSMTQLSEILLIGPSLSKTSITSNENEYFEKKETENIVIYPNPFTDYVRVNLSVDNAFSSVKIYTIIGQLIAERKIDSGENYIEFNSLKNNKGGMFLVVFEGENSRTIFKIFKE